MNWDQAYMDWIHAFMPGVYNALLTKYTTRKENTIIELSAETIKPRILMRRF